MHEGDASRARRLPPKPVCAVRARPERMPFDSAFFNTWRPRTLAVLRIVTAYLFLQHGTAKLLGIPAVEMFKEGVPLLSMGGIAGLLEIVGGLLLLIGLLNTQMPSRRTR